LGVLEDIPAEEPVAQSPQPAQSGVQDGEGGNGAPEPVKPAAPVRQDPTVVGAGRARKLSDFEGSKSAAAAGVGPTAGGSREIDWSNVGRNDPCPCGSGKKYKKCHGA
jgi:preprotein translocase subunit SecA